MNEPAPQNLTTPAEPTILGPVDGAPEVAVPAGYEILGTIDEGGMGVVYRARDCSLDRLVALKSLQSQNARNPTATKRFLYEAQITARLQHPGIPPVHQVGQLPDGRPFLAMKLIQGETLDRLLSQQGPGAGRWLAVFEAICQAVAYAHSQGVIHRDLKPRNVMVGAFGEVQVMDWGLAKSLTRRVEESAESENDPNATHAHEEGSAPLLPDGDQTHAGSVLGTPPFMPPEQAIGAVDKLDRRSDVFGLGAILCTLLTGKPPFLGTSSEATRQLAALARLDDAFARLDGCGAEPALIALAKRCLSAEQSERPADAGVLAEEVARQRREADERARQAELQQVRAQSQADEQRKRRRVLMLAGGVLVVVLLAGIVGTTVGLIRAEQAHQEEAKQKANAEHRLYHAHVNLAMQAWEEGHLGRVRQLLARHQPREGETDRRSFEWYYLWRLTHGDRMTLGGHQRWVRALAVSSDGRRMATGGYDARVRIWDPETGTQLAVLEGHTGYVHRVGFSPDGRMVISAGDDFTVRVWEWSTGKQRYCFEHEKRVWAAAFSSDGETLASAGFDGKVYLRYTATGKLWPGFPTSIDPVSCLAFSPDGRWLALGADHGIVHIWDLKEDKKTRHKIHPGGLDVLSITFASKGKLLACGCRDGGVCLWDCERAMRVRSWVHAAPTELQSTSLYGIAFSPDDLTLATACWDGTIKTWEVKTGREKEMIRGHVDSVKAVVFFPGKPNQLASSSKDGTVKLWQLPVGQQAAVDAAEALSHALPDRDGKHLLTIGKGGAARRWNLTTGREGPPPPDAAVAVWSRDGSVRATLESKDGTGAVRVWGKTPAREPRVIPMPAKGVYHAIALSPEGDWLVVAGEENDGDHPFGVVRFWNLATGREAREPWTGARTSIRGVAFSADGRTLATGHQDGMVKLWDVETGEEKVSLRRGAEPVIGLAFSADGRTLAVAEQTGRIELFRAATPAEVSEHKQRMRER